MSLCATEATKGFYFGYFWVFYMSGQIFGNLIGAITIEKTSGPGFYLILGCAMLLAVPCFAFMRIPKRSLMDESCAEMPFWKVIESTLKLVTSKSMMYVNLQIIWTGVLISYYTGILVPI